MYTMLIFSVIILICSLLTFIIVWKKVDTSENIEVLENLHVASVLSFIFVLGFSISISIQVFNFYKAKNTINLLNAEYSTFRRKKIYFRKDAVIPDNFDFMYA